MRLILSGIELFKGIPDAELEALARISQTRAFRSGVVLMRQGEPSDTLHIIVKGRVRVARSHPHGHGTLMLAALGPGEVIGEMGVLDGQPRSATVTAIDDTVTVEITAAALTEVLRKYPEFAAALLRLLTRRLRRTDELAEEAAHVRNTERTPQPPRGWEEQ